MRQASCCPGELVFDTRYAVFRGRLVDTDFHAHAAGQWMAAPAGARLGVRLPDGAALEGRVILVGPHERHALVPPATDLVVVWFDPSRVRDATLMRECRRRVCALRLTPEIDARLAATFAAPAGGAFRRAAADLADALLAHTGAGRDPIVSAATQAIDHDPDALPGAPDLARRFGLSAGTLARRFRAQVGMTPRAYRLWARLKRGLLHATTGANLTTAAHAAGFADAAHFTRTFRRHFGLAPSQVAPLLSRGRETAR